MEYKTITVSEIKKTYDLGIVLSGVSENRFDRFNDNIFFNFSGIAANRLTQSIELYKLGKIRKLMLSGGWSNIIGEKISESERTRLFLLRLGIPEEDIIVEGNSINTYENALYCKKKLAELNDDVKQSSKLLLTSAFHTYRAKKCFEKVGLEVTPFSVDYHFYKKTFSFNDLIPSATALIRWQMLIKEWVGIIAYKLHGYI